MVINMIKNDHLPFLNQKLSTEPCVLNNIYIVTQIRCAGNTVMFDFTKIQIKIKYKIVMNFQILYILQCWGRSRWFR